MANIDDKRNIDRLPSGRWRARVPVGRGQRITVGTFDTLEEAQRQRDQAFAAERQAQAQRINEAMATMALSETTPAGRVTDTTEGNERSVSYVSPDVRTLQDLIRECQIDLSIWHIYKWEANKWPVGAKLAKRRLRWENGQIVEGELDDDGTLTVSPLFQVKAWMVRRQPLPITLAVQPVELHIHQPKEPTPPPESEIRRALIIPDLQIGFRRDISTGRLDPFHDRLAMSVVLQVAQGGSFDRVIYLGDLVDATEWTDKFVKEPEFYFTTQPAVIELAWFMGQIRRALPVSRQHALEGNHDARIPVALASHMLAAYQLRPADQLEMPAPLTMPRLLGLPGIGVEWVGGYPSAEVWITERLRCVHGDVARGKPGGTAAEMVQGARSTIFGHIHRIERATRTEYTGDRLRTVTALSPGCLCRLDGVVPGHRRSQNWQQGFAAVTYTADHDSIEVVEIRNGKAVFAGRMYSGVNYAEALREDTGQPY